MKHVGRILIGAVTLVLVFAGPAAAQITNSSHDLSTSSTSGGPTATTETQICITCHTPHQANNQELIWNHTPTAATPGWAAATTTRLGTTLPTSLSPYSQSCLDCHDGSIALGDVSNAGGGTAGTIAGLTGLMAAAYQVGAGGNMDGNHPVSIPYAGEAGSSATADGTLGNYYATTTAGCDSGGTCTTGPTNGTYISLIDNAGVAQVECGTCHEPHNKYSANGYFLRASEAGSAICLACHNK